MRSPEDLLRLVDLRRQVAVVTDGDNAVAVTGQLGAQLLIATVLLRFIVHRAVLSVRTQSGRGTRSR